MRRTFSVDLYAMNISAEPHPDGTYESLIKRMFDEKTPIKIWGERNALLTEVHWRRKKNSETRTAAYGVISTYTDIDVDAPWLNKRTGKAAEDTETRRIVIPDSLRPHLAQFLFYFDLKRHLFVFQGDSRMPKRTGGYKRYVLTPVHVKNHLERIFVLPSVKGDLKSINVTVVPDPDTVTQILRHENIREITMMVTTPNSDNIAAERGRVRQRLQALNARRRVEIYTAQDDSEGIEPDEQMVKLAKVAALDGKVTARVATNEGVVALSTDKKPLLRRVTVDTDIEPESVSIRRGAEDLTSNVKDD
jgi:hypothetical protein